MGAYETHPTLSLFQRIPKAEIASAEQTLKRFLHRASIVSRLLPLPLHAYPFPVVMGEAGDRRASVAGSGQARYQIRPDDLLFLTSSVPVFFDRFSRYPSH